MTTETCLLTGQNILHVITLARKAWRAKQVTGKPGNTLLTHMVASLSVNITAPS